MDISNITKNLGTVVGRSVLQVRKHSPEILTAVGIAGFITAGVLGARATLKLEDTIDEGNARIQDIHDIAEMTEDQQYSEATIKAMKQQLTLAYIKNIYAIGKLYAPSVGLAVLSATAVVGSHRILKGRNVALVAAYKTLESAYSAYRERVVEEYGEEKDLDFHRGTHDEEITDEKTGKKTKVKVKTLDSPEVMSAYARCFDEYNNNFVPFADRNLFFLKAQQTYLNNLLQSRGHVLLNDVYDKLGFDRTKAGAVVGWVIGNDGDNFIDFGIYEARNSQFVNGDERSIWLDFNVDGVVYDKIG